MLEISDRSISDITVTTWGRSRTGTLVVVWAPMALGSLLAVVGTDVVVLGDETKDPIRVASALLSNPGFLSVSGKASETTTTIECDCFLRGSRPPKYVRL